MVNITNEYFLKHLFTLQIARALKMTMETPWIKVYNNKLVIVLNVENLSNE